MEKKAAYIPRDRRLALAEGRSLPEHSHGAALFADISGFTPLTEMLAHTLGPKRGAEELTIYLNQVYDALITELHQYNGSVIGFSGDAITCWFDGDDGLRATATALAMQAAMAKFANLTVSGGGHVSLGMKAAVAVGPVRRFVVGDPNYTLLDVMAGKTLENLASAEHQAEKGEVVLDQAAATSLGTRIAVADWRIDEHSGERFISVIDLRVEPPAKIVPQIDDDTLSDDITRSWLLPAVYRLLQAGQGEFLAELRQASALFLRFGGIDYDLDADAPQKLDAFIQHVQRVLARFDGSLLQLTLGDKGSYLYAAFGAPIAHEDDVDRAASAALEIQALPSHLDFIDSLQIGITYGRMRVGAYGGVARRTYGVLGDAVNLSARLMQAAQPGQILVSKEAYSRASHAFLWKELPTIRVKGKSEPIALYQLLQLRRRRVGLSLETQFPETPLGRETVLAQMTTGLDKLSAGQGQVLRLMGAAGMGKSHLAAHFIRQAQEKKIEVVTGFCQSITRSAVYAPWQQIFYALLGLQDSSEVEAVDKLTSFLTTDHPEWLVRLPLLGDLLGLPIPDNGTTAALDSTLRQASLFSLLIEMVQVWAGKRPLILLIDNAQWLDEASQALTTALAQQACSTSPIMICLIHRPPQPGDTLLLAELAELDNYTQLILAEMTDREVAALAERRLSAPITQLLLHIVQQMARGNPFFVSELLEALRDQAQIDQNDQGQWGVAKALLDALRRANFVVQIDGQWQLIAQADLSTVKLGIPDSIHGLILSRLDRLPEAYKLTLKVSSVIGQTIDLALVSQAHPEKKDMPEVEAEAAYLETEEVMMHSEIPEEKIYAFRHQTTQEVAYDTLLFTQRQQLHRVVAEALIAQQEEITPQIATQIAYHAYAGEVWPVSLKFNLIAGEQAKQLHATQQAIDFFQKALRSAQDIAEKDTAEERKRIHLALGEMYISTGQYEEVSEHLKTALSLARKQGDHQAEAQSCRWYGRAHEQKGEYTLALTWLEKGFSALNGTISLEEAELSLLSGLINIRQGNYDRAIELCQRSLQVGEALNDIAVRARTYNLLGISDLRSSSGNAIDRFQESLAQYEQIGNVYGQATSHNLIANGYFAKGELSLADFHYRQSLDLFTQIGHAYNQVLVNNNLGGIAIKQGRLDAALGYYQRAVRQLEQIHGSLWVFGALHLNIGNTHIQRQELDEASEELQLAEAYFDQARIQDLLPELYGLFAELYWRQDDWTAAEQYGEKSLKLAREMEMPREEGHNLRIMGEISFAQQLRSEALEYFEKSHQLLSEAGDTYEQAKTELSLSRFYNAEGNIEEARRMLAACEPVFTRLEAQLDLMQVQQVKTDLTTSI